MSKGWRYRGRGPACGGTLWRSEPGKSTSRAVCSAASSSTSPCPGRKSAERVVKPHPRPCKTRQRKEIYCENRGRCNAPRGGPDRERGGAERGHDRRRASFHACQVFERGAATGVATRVDVPARNKKRRLFKAGAPLTTATVTWLAHSTPATSAVPCMCAELKSPAPFTLAQHSSTWAQGPIQGMCE